MDNRHSERQIVDIVAVICLFGFPIRWNNTLATPLKNEPLELAPEPLAERGWVGGKCA